MLSSELAIDCDAVQWRQGAQGNHKPVVILLTDSEDWHHSSSVQQLLNIMAAESQLPESEQLSVHVIGFGARVDVNFIEQLATIGNGSHLVCQTGGDMDRLDLVTAFSQLAAQPALKVSLLATLRGAPVAAASAPPAGCDSSLARRGERASCRN